MNAPQPYFLPISFTPVSTPSNSPSRKCPMWTPDNERTPTSAISYYVPISNSTDAAQAKDGAVTELDYKHKTFPVPNSFGSSVVNSPSIQQSVITNQTISATYPLVPVHMPWNSVRCQTYEYGYDGFDCNRHWIPRCFPQQHAQYLCSVGTNEEMQVYSDGDESKHEDEISTNICLNGPGPPIVTSKKVKGPRGCNLFVFHLPNEITNWDLYLLFRRFGTILSAQTIVHRITGLSKGFGFISFSTKEEAQAAIAEMNGFRLGKKRLKVQLKRLQNEADDQAIDDCVLEEDVQNNHAEAETEAEAGPRAF